MERFMKKPAAGASAPSRPPQRDRSEDEHSDEEQERRRPAQTQSQAPRGGQAAKQSNPFDEDDEGDEEEEEDEEEDEDEEEEEEVRMPPPARFANKSAAAASGPSAAELQRRRMQLEAEQAEEAARMRRRGGGGGGGGGGGRRGDDSDSYVDDEDDESERSHSSDEDFDDEELDSYPLGDSGTPAKKYKQPKLRFDLSTFADGAFDAGAFVSDMTRELFEQQDPNDLDPAPFAVLFDSALARLNALRDETDRNIARCAREARAAEEAHKEGLANLHESLQTVFAKFRRLDGRISSVAHTAVRIGHTLQTVDQQKSYNMQGQEIIQHFLAFNKGDRAALPPIFSAGNTNPAELHRAAELIQMLSAISQDIKVKGTEKAAELIAKTSNDIENQLISRFDAASKTNQLMEMKACAATLLNFRGRSIIKRYVFNVMTQLDSYCKEREKERDDKRGGGGEDAEDRGVVGSFKSSLARLYRGVTLITKEQCAICAVIFPQPLAVIRAILERVFQDKIAGEIDAVLGDRRLTHESFLRMLDFAHTSTQELVVNLLAAIRGVAVGPHGNTASIIVTRGRGGGGGVLGAEGGTAAGPGDASSAVGGMGGMGGLGLGGSSGGEQLMNLQDQVSGIFSSYRDQSISRELQLMSDVVGRGVNEVLALEAPRASSSSLGGEGGGGGNVEDETDMFGRVKKSILADQKQKWVLLVLEHHMVDRLIAHSSAAVARADKLSDPVQLPEHVAQLFSHVCTGVLEAFLAPVLEAALEFLPPAEPKTEPDPFFFQVVGLTNLVADKLQLHYQLWIAPRLAPNPNTQVICDTRVRELFGRVEGQISAGLARCLQAHLKYVARLLASKQRNSDYRPRDDDSDAVLDGKPSPACEAVCLFVKAQYDAILTCLDGKNLDKFLTVLGIKLHDILVVHLQKLSVSTMGAGLLARDMKEYQRVISLFHLSPVLEKWAELRQLVDLFFVGVEYLRAVINDSSKLTKMPHKELLQWIQMRADYGENKRRILTSLNLQDSGYDEARE